MLHLEDNTPINYLERLHETVNNREHLLSQLQKYSKEDNSPMVAGGDKRLNSSLLNRLGGQNSNHRRNQRSEIIGSDKFQAQGMSEVVRRSQNSQLPKVIPYYSPDFHLPSLKRKMDRSSERQSVNHSMV